MGDDFDTAESSGSSSESSSPFPKSFLHDLESSLFNSSKIQKKPKRKRRKIPKHRFKNLEQQLDQIIIQRTGDYVKVADADLRALDHDEFDFCDVSDGPGAQTIGRPCGITRENFKNAMAIIKQKEFKLKKTERFVEDVEGVEVKTDSAYHSALSKIFQRRKYFDVEDENEDMMELDI